MLSYLKNPIVLGILVAIVTYIYLDKKAKDKYKRNPEGDKPKRNIITPLVAGVIVWFISSSYFDSQNISSKNISSRTGNMIGGNINNIETKPIESNPVFKTNPTSEHIFSDNKSFRVISKNNIKLPDTDVFIEFAEF